MTQEESPAAASSTTATSRSAMTLILKQAQTIVTFVYLVMVGVGMLYYHQKYSLFGINIFQYADIFYFLIAPFEDSFILVLCFVAVTLFTIGLWADRFIERKYPKFYRIMVFGLYDKPWYKTSWTVSWIVSFIAILYIYAEIYGESTLEKVLESSPITVAFEGGDTVTGRMIGKTDSTLFLLENDEVKAIPLGASVQEIVVAKFDEAAVTKELDPKSE